VLTFEGLISLVRIALTECTFEKLLSRLSDRYLVKWAHQAENGQIRRARGMNKCHAIDSRIFDGEALLQLLSIGSAATPLARSSSIRDSRAHRVRAHQHEYRRGYLALEG
jgi:hypothetical protein